MHLGRATLAAFAAEERDLHRAGPDHLRGAALLLVAANAALLAEPHMLAVLAADDAAFDRYHALLPILLLGSDWLFEYLLSDGPRRCFGWFRRRREYARRLDAVVGFSRVRRIVEQEFHKRGLKPLFHAFLPNEVGALNLARRCQVAHLVCSVGAVFGFAVRKEIL